MITQKRIYHEFQFIIHLWKRVDSQQYWTHFDSYLERELEIQLGKLGNQRKLSTQFQDRLMELNK